MNGIVIIGLGRFGTCMLQVLSKRRRSLIVIDQDDAKIQSVRDVVTKAIKADAVSQGFLEEVLPGNVDCAIVDLGDVIGKSILVTNYLHKLGVPQIIVEAEDAEHAEILTIVGATHIVFPELEAAERVAGKLAGRGVIDFFAVGGGFSMVEVPVPSKWVGSSAVVLGIREKFEVEVIATRKSGVSADEEDWNLVDRTRAFERGDIVLLAGDEKRLAGFTK